MEKKTNKKEESATFLVPFIDPLFVTGRGEKVGVSGTLIVGLRVVDFDVD